MPDSHSTMLFLAAGLALNLGALGRCRFCLAFKLARLFDLPVEQIFFDS